MIPKHAPSAWDEAPEQSKAITFPQPAANAGTPQGVVGPMRCQGTLLAHVQLGVNHNPIPFCMGLLPGLSQAACIGWVAPFQTQNPALALVKLFVSLVIFKPSYLSRSLCAEGRQQFLPTYSFKNVFSIPSSPVSKSSTKTLKYHPQNGALQNFTRLVTSLM